MRAMTARILMPLVLAALGTLFAAGAARAAESRFYFAKSIALPDGKVLAIGGVGTFNPEPNYSWGVMRVNADGTPDASFGRGGFVAIPIFHYFDWPFTAVALPDGRIVIGGMAADSGVGTDPRACYPLFCNTYPALARLNADGTLDRSFNGTGKLVLAIGELNRQLDVPDEGYLTSVTVEGPSLVVWTSAGRVASIDADGTVHALKPAPLNAAAFTPGRVAMEEFYHAQLDHYFMTWIADEKYALDTGSAARGWERTGRTILVERTEQAGLVPVCRFYLPPAAGDSHFYGRGQAECDATASGHPSFVLEAPAFFYVALPANGTCPSQTVPVYRVFDNRPDGNHRYVVDKALRDAMVAAGWIAEGDGADAVAMCALG